MGKGGAGRWSRAAGMGRQRVRGYVAALVLTAGLVTAPPFGRVAQPVAIVRTRDRYEHDRFDSRERVAAAMVLTVPVEPGTIGHGHVAAWPPHRN